MIIYVEKNYSVCLIDPLNPSQLQLFLSVPTVDRQHYRSQQLLKSATLYTDQHFTVSVLWIPLCNTARPEPGLDLPLIQQCHSHHQISAALGAASRRPAVGDSFYCLLCSRGRVVDAKNVHGPSFHREWV